MRVVTDYGAVFVTFDEASDEEIQAAQAENRVAEEVTPIGVVEWILPYPKNSLVGYRTMRKYDPRFRRSFEWLVEGLIPKFYITALTGDGGAGKSLLAQEWMICSYLGKPFLGLPTPKLRFGWLDLDVDNPAGVMRNIDRLLRGHGVDPDNLPSDIDEYFRMSSYESGDLDDEHGWEGVDVLVLDSWTHWVQRFEGGEDEADATNRAFATVRKMMKSVSIDSAIIIHHNNKVGMFGARRVRGSSAFVNQVRMNLAVDFLPENRRVPLEIKPQRILRPTKQNYGRGKTEVAFVVEDLDADGKVTDAIDESGAMRFREIAVMSESESKAEKSKGFTMPTATERAMKDARIVEVIAAHENGLSGNRPLREAVREAGIGIGNDELSNIVNRLVGEGKITKEKEGRAFVFRAVSKPKNEPESETATE